MDQTNATIEHGVLTVTVPKEEVKKQDLKSIEIVSAFRFVNKIGFVIFPFPLEACLSLASLCKTCL